MQLSTLQAYSGQGSSGAQAATGSYSASQAEDQLVLNSFQNTDSENVDVSFSDPGKGITITAQQIVDKLNELLKDKLPKGLESLKPEEVTPEASADRVAKSVTGLFDAFAKQNKDLSPDELVAKFIEQAKDGVEQGYGDAHDILDGLGAFSFDGVEEGIAKTKDLILQKLDNFAKIKLEDLQNVNKNAASATSSEVLAQAGVSLLQQAA